MAVWPPPFVLSRFSYAWLFHFQNFIWYWKRKDMVMLWSQHNCRLHTREMELPIGASINSRIAGLAVSSHRGSTLRGRAWNGCINLKKFPSFTLLDYQSFSCSVEKLATILEISTHMMDVYNCCPWEHTVAFLYHTCWQVCHK